MTRSDSSAGSFEGAYSAVADKQLDALEAGDDPDLYHAVLDACDLVFRATGLAQARSSAIQADEGIRFRHPVVGHEPHKVFWSQGPDGPRIEAVFPYP